MRWRLSAETATALMFSSNGLRLKSPVRPMLRALQDVYSRKILAWRIGLNENTALVRLALTDLLRDWADYTLFQVA